MAPTETVDLVSETSSIDESMKSEEVDLKTLPDSGSRKATCAQERDERALLKGVKAVDIVDLTSDTEDAGK